MNTANSNCRCSRWPDPMADSAQTCPLRNTFLSFWKRTRCSKSTILPEEKLREMYVTCVSNVYKFMKLIKKKIRERESEREREYKKSQIHRGEICGSGVIINPLREQAVVYVAFYVYKIVRITEKRGRTGGREGRLRQRWYNARKFAKGEEV